MNWEETKDSCKAKSEDTGNEYKVIKLDQKWSVSINKKEVKVDGSLLLWDNSLDAKNWCQEYDDIRAGKEA
jgi:RNase P/RNase MRP subunit p29